MTEEHDETLLAVDDLRLDIDGTPVLTGVSLRLATGEALGVVGESGSGKSMTLRCIARLTPPGSRTAGSIRLAGQDVGILAGQALRRHRRELGFVFQDPRAAINPVHTIGAFLTERARDRGADVPQARARAGEALVEMGIPDAERRMGQHPHELSGGLLQRVMIASVLAEHPALLLADEPTTALDVTTQSDVLALTDRLRGELGTAMIFVTHDLDLAVAVCDRIAVIYAGRTVETADTGSIADRPLHPYTRGLLASRPPLTRRLETIPVIPGVPVSAAAAGAGCPFAPRCPVALPVCRERFPAAETYGATEVHCHRSAEIAAGRLETELSSHPNAVSPVGP